MTFYNFDASGEFVECSHEFEIDLNYLVTAHYKITMEGIEREENDVISRTEQESAGETDPEVVNSWVSHELAFYDDLKVAARNLALVALVTRLHHWVSRYARRLNPDRKVKRLKTELAFLNSNLSHEPPVPASFFEELVNLRDSVVHGDSKPEWDHDGKLRRVADKYVRGNYRVEISDEDFVGAIDAAIKQVTWYDDELRAISK